jgi:integrase
MGRKRRKRARGEGTIVQRPDGTWMGQITTHYDPATRKQTRATVYAATERECVEALQKARQEAQEASGAALGAMKVRDALDFWLAQIKNKVRESSAIKYDRDVERLTHYLGHLALADLTPEHVVKMFKKMEEENIPSSARRQAGVRLRQACRFMTFRGILSRNPAEGVYLPKHTAEEIHPLTQEQARHLLQTARDGQCRMYALWALALDTGARRGELLALEPGDVDWERGEIYIHRALKESQGRLTVADLKTKHSRRRVRIAPGTVAALRAHLEATRTRSCKGAARVSLGHPIFCNGAGNHFRGPHLYRDHWGPLLERAGLDIRFHDLRHTCATLLLQAGVHVKAVSERLGHSSITITLETYAHVLPTMQEAVAGVVEGLLWAS